MFLMFFVHPAAIGLWVGDSACTLIAHKTVRSQSSESALVRKRRQDETEREREREEEKERASIIIIICMRHEQLFLKRSPEMESLQCV
jgi:hypothetical protein